MALPGKDRAARILSPALPKPLTASLDRHGSLTWTWYASHELGAERKSPALRKFPGTLCFDFGRLADGSDEQIRQFAQKWGPLGLEGLRNEEDVADWRRYAQLAQALLRFTGERASGGRGADEDWKTISEFGVSNSVTPRSIERSSLHAHVQLAIAGLAVNQWFATARGHGILALVQGTLQVRPGASNLFGILISQIAHVMARSDQTVVCAGCRSPFRPKRPLSHGSRQYCSGCRKAKVPQRDASRDRRRRIRVKELGIVVGRGVPNSYLEL